MSQLGNGLHGAKHYEDALTVRETELSLARRLGSDEEDMLVTQTNLASTYHFIGRPEEALSMRQEVYSGNLKLNGEEHQSTLIAAGNLADSLGHQRHYEEARSLLRKSIPVARRVLGESHDLTLRMRWCYAQALSRDPIATLDNLRAAATTLEDVERTARRVMGGAHPTTEGIKKELRDVRAALDARKT